VQGSHDEGATVMQKSKFLAAGAAVVAGLFLAGCGNVLATDEVEKDIQAQIAAQLELPLEDVGEVSCPDSLDAEVGKETTCIYIDFDDEEYDVVVRVASVDDEGKYFIQIVEFSDEPN
jgi:hypothetical protein